MLKSLRLGAIIYLYFYCIWKPVGFHKKKLLKLTQRDDENRSKHMFPAPKEISNVGKRHEN